MKNYYFGKPREILVNLLLIIFLILLSIGGIITVSAEQKDEEKFQTVEVISDIKWEQFSGKYGGELYIRIIPSGGLCEVEIDNDGDRRLFASYDGFIQEIKESSNGWVSDNRTCMQGKLIGYLYNSPPVFENECLEKLPKEVRKEVFRTVYIANIFR